MGNMGSVVRGVGSSTVVRGSVGSYRPVIVGAKLREGTTTILPREGERSRESPCLQCGFTPLAGDTRTMKTDTKGAIYACKRISYWIDRRLTGLAGPDYAAIISFGLPIEPEDSQYGEFGLQACWGKMGAIAEHLVARRPGLVRCNRNRFFGYLHWR